MVVKVVVILLLATLAPGIAVPQGTQPPSSPPNAPAGQPAPSLPTVPPAAAGTPSTPRWLNYVGFAGVLVNFVGLLFVVLQLREAQKGIRFQTTLQATDKIMKIDEMLIERPELASIFSSDRTLGSEPATVQKRSFAFLMLNYFATMFILRRKGHIDADEWVPYENYFCDIMGGEDFKRLWAEIKDESWYYAPFEQYVSDVIRKGPRRTTSKPAYEVGLDIKEILDPDSREFSESLELYESAFPDSEKEKPERIRTWISQPNAISPDRYHLLRLLDVKTRRVEGIAMFHYLADANIGFLSYITVSETQRNRGYGSFLLSAVKEVLDHDARWEGKGGLLGIFTELEVEDPADPATFDRFRFWERHHVLPLDMHWEYPLLRDGHSPAHMYLAFLPFSREDDALPVPQSESAARAIYRGVYRLASDTPGLRRIIDSLSGRPLIHRKRIRMAAV